MVLGWTGDEDPCIDSIHAAAAETSFPIGVKIPCSQREAKRSTKRGAFWLGTPTFFCTSHPPWLRFARKCVIFPPSLSHSLANGGPRDIKNKAQTAFVTTSWFCWVQPLIPPASLRVSSAPLGVGSRRRQTMLKVVSVCPCKRHNRWSKMGR